MIKTFVIIFMIVAFINLFAGSTGEEYEDN